MTRKRFWVFLDAEEEDLIRQCKPRDESFGATFRRLAIARAQWLVTHQKKQQPQPAYKDPYNWENNSQTHTTKDDGPSVERNVNWGA